MPPPKARVRSGERSRSSTSRDWSASTARILVGVELFGFVGAMLAIPAAGALQVVIKAARREYHQSRLRVDQPRGGSSPFRR